VRIHLVAPRNPESFWTMTRILRMLGKRCVYPNLALPTLAGLTPSDWEVSLCDENVEEVDFDVDADIVGITGYIVHKKRMFELIEGFQSRGKLVVVGGPYATLCPEELQGEELQGWVPAGSPDVLFVGEAEETWGKFLSDYAFGSFERVYRAPRRRLLTLSMLLETAIRKPARLRDAVTLALMHKHFYEYVGELSEGLDRLIETLRECPDSVALLPEPAPPRPKRRRRVAGSEQPRGSSPDTRARTRDRNGARFSPFPERVYSVSTCHLRGRQVFSPRST
jgi:radical SAM superfamily enzyme YgiQ (UPF0313 family)